MRDETNDGCVGDYFCLILVPRARDPSGLRQGSRTLACSGRIPVLIGYCKYNRIRPEEKFRFNMADCRTPTKRYSKVENSVCRTCNGNIILKNHPLDLFGVKVTEEGIVSDLEKFCGFKITCADGFPSRICRACYVKVTKFQEFVKMVVQSKTQQESVIRSKRAKSFEDSPTSASSPSSRREKKKTKVRPTRHYALFNFDMYRKLMCRNCF